MGTPGPQQYCINNQWNNFPFQHVAYGLSPEASGMPSYPDNFTNPSHFSYQLQPFMNAPQENQHPYQATYIYPQSFPVGTQLINPEISSYYVSPNMPAEQLPYSPESNHYVQLADISPPSMTYPSSRSFSLPY